MDYNLKSDKENITPLVTVNILSFNRKDELRITLTKVFEQDYKNIEVIVVDNASSDGTQKMVKTEFPEVKLIELDKNIGIAGWNRGFEVAKGDFVLVLDDDAYPEKKSITIIEEIFNKNYRYGALAFKVLNHYENNLILPFPGGWSPTNETKSKKTNILLGCTFAIRKNLYVKNLFSEKYFLYFHELPIILHIKNLGYDIFYDKKLVAHHINRKLNNYKKKNEYLHFRNMINFVLYCFPKRLNILYSLRIALFYLPRAFKKKWLSYYIEAIYDLRKNFIIFQYNRLTVKQVSQILDANIIEYKFLKKIKRFI